MIYSNWMNSNFNL